MDLSIDSTFDSKPVTSVGKVKHAVGIGFLITAIGVFSYFLFFYQFPSFRDNSIINVVLVMLGVFLSVFGSWKVFTGGSSKIAKIFTSLTLMLTLALASLFNFYLFYLSYQLPIAAFAPAIDSAAPDFTLTDHQGKQIKLSDLRGQKVVISFYRGYW